MPSSNKTFAFITEGDGFLLPITPLLLQAVGKKPKLKGYSLQEIRELDIPLLSEQKGLQDYQTIQLWLKMQLRLEKLNPLE